MSYNFNTSNKDNVDIIHQNINMTRAFGIVKRKKNSLNKVSYNCTSIQHSGQ
jgi:hypothetical protein